MFAPYLLRRPAARRVSKKLESFRWRRRDAVGISYQESWQKRAFATGTTSIAENWKTKVKSLQFPVKFRPLSDPEKDAQDAVSALQNWREQQILARENGFSSASNVGGGPDAGEIQPFAYPKSEAFPTATLGLLTASVLSTLAVSWYWKKIADAGAGSRQNSIATREDVNKGATWLRAYREDQNRQAVPEAVTLVSATQAQGDRGGPDTTSRTNEEDTAVFVDTLYFLMKDPLAASFIRWSDLPKIQAFLATVFFVSATFLEKCRGPRFVLSLALGSTLATNASLNCSFGSCPALGTNAGLTAVAGYLWASKFSRCAAWRSIYLPLGWVVFAPLLVFEGLQCRDWVMKLRYACAVTEEGEDGSDRLPQAGNGEAASASSGCDKNMLSHLLHLPAHCENEYKETLVTQLQGSLRSDAGPEAEDDGNEKIANKLRRVDDNGFLIDSAGFLIGCAVAWLQIGL
ncbi:unnamed protein product [Amoebophrya sp. A120]|nr:unnamed protein product [Amoebophrya sp. A120]|eukprot:GSA120T00020200001.1